MERIELIFLSQTTMFRWWTLLLGSLTVTLTVLLYWVFFSWPSTCSRIIFLPLENSDHVSASVAISFPSSSIGDALFYRAAYMTILVLIGTVFVIIWKMLHGKISLNLVPLLLVLNSMSWSRLEFMYVSLIINIRSSLTHLYGFQLLVLMP